MPLLPLVHQLKFPELGSASPTDGAANRNRWTPFTSSKGVNCQVFTVHAPVYANLAAMKAHDAYIRAFNVRVAAERSSAPLDLNALFQAEFDAATLHTCAPFIDAARVEFNLRRAEKAGPVPMMWRSNHKTVPAVGILRSWLEEVVASGKVPEEAKGITMDDVLDACFKQNPKGLFTLMVKYRSRTRSEAQHSTWLTERHRHPFSDLGLALGHDGLHVSLLSPKDSRIPVVRANGRWAGWYVDQLDFQCGLKPIRWCIPMEMLLEPDFAEVLSLAFRKLHVQLRTVVLDASVLPNLPIEARRATVHFHRWFQASCADARVIYYRVPTIGTERRRCRDFFSSTSDVDAQVLLAIMAHSSAECPHCRAEVLLKTDTITGTPVNQVETCGNCNTTWEVGLLLAERARVHGAFGWVPDDGYSCG